MSGELIEIQGVLLGAQRGSGQNCYSWIVETGDRNPENYNVVTVRTSPKRLGADHLVCTKPQTVKLGAVAKITGHRKYSLGKQRWWILATSFEILNKGESQFEANPVWRYRKPT